MTHKLVVALAAAVVLPLASCSSSSGSSSGGTPSPSTPAATAPLVGTTWLWSHLTETNPMHQSVVPDPNRYTLTLGSDGSYQALADCNQLSGQYTLSGSSLTLHPGPMTLAHCGEHSLSSKYVSLLGSVATYALGSGGLTLKLANGAGEMGFVT